MTKSSCLIIAGEKSGEDHAMTFFPELVGLTPDTEYFGVGGDKLKEQGVELMYHAREFSSVGITEVLGKIRFYFKAMDLILEQVDKRNCKTAILVDFQGFNLKIAAKLKKRGVKVLYYVAPQAWVWKPWRAKTIENNVHTLFTILPFEKKWFAERGVKNIKAVVHPLKVEYGEKLQSIRKRSFSDFNLRPNKEIRLLMLPGSRNPEVEALLPIFIRGVELLKEEGFNIKTGLVKVETVKPELYDNSSVDNLWESTELIEGFDWADICFASSGTVTLATGLFELPTVVAYKLSLVNEFLLKIFIPYKGPASLTNIILGKMIFPEILQFEADRYNLAKFARQWLTDEKKYNKTIEDLSKTSELISGDDFSTAEYMAQVIKK
jgi:lipid-A-disaccharide synthase